MTGFVGDCVALQEFECVSAVSKADQQELISGVESHYQDFSDLKADFIQQSYFTGLGERVVSKGNVHFKKPGMMDWRYEQPEKQQFVADGSTLWFFQPDLNQVTLGDFTEAFDSDLPVSFLLGVGRLSENFALESACSSEEGIILKLVPKQQDPNLDQFYLLVRKLDHVPVGAKIIDIGGNETIITFHKLALNVGLKKEQFSFKIPRGVDIIDHRSKRGKLPAVKQ